MKVPDPDTDHWLAEINNHIDEVERTLGDLRRLRGSMFRAAHQAGYSLEQIGNLSDMTAAEVADAMIRTRSDEAKQGTR